MIYPNGSESVMSPGPFSQLVCVRNCPCVDDGKVRSVYGIGVPSTAWTAPGYVRAQGKIVSGYVTCDEQGYTFHANRNGRNFRLVCVPEKGGAS